MVSGIFLAAIVPIFLFSLIGHDTMEVCSLVIWTAAFIGLNAAVRDE